MDQKLLSSVIGAIVHQKHDGSTLVGDDAVRWLSGGGLSHVVVEPASGDRWGFERRGVELLEQMASGMFAAAPERVRGARGVQLRPALAKLIIERFRKSSIPEPHALATFARELDDWWDRRTLPRRYLIPCAIIPYEADDFQIGPVRFVHWLRLAAQADALPADDFATDIARENLVKALNSASACWIAIVNIEGALPDRAEELADLAVDVALVGAQLAIPVAYSRTMARLTARTAPASRCRIVVSDGRIEVGAANKSAGLALSGPAFDQMLTQSKDVIQAVGRRLSSFTSGQSGPLPMLDRAWCDGAYWFHEGLAELLDSVAVAKLETAIEVLLRAVNKKGSEKRIRQAIGAVTGLGPDDIIAPGSRLTVAKLAGMLVGARSQVLHGTYSTLSAGLASERASLEGLAYMLLATTALGIDRYAASGTARDDVDSFLGWLDDERATSASGPT